VRVVEAVTILGEEKVICARQFNDAEVKKYRSDLDALNKRIDAYNAEVARYQDQVSAYQALFAKYQEDFESWQRDELRSYDKEYNDYVHRFQVWRAENASGLSGAAGIRNASYRMAPEEPLSLLSSRSIAQKASLPVLERVTRYDTAQLEELMQFEQEEQVGTRTFFLSIEVLDSKTGEVTWVTNAQETMRAVFDEAQLLEDLVRRLTRGK
jgi:hypothetical protein